MATGFNIDNITFDTSDMTATYIEKMLKGVALNHNVFGEDGVVLDISSPGTLNQLLKQDIVDRVKLLAKKADYYENPPSEFDITEDPA